MLSQYWLFGVFTLVIVTMVLPGSAASVVDGTPGESLCFSFLSVVSLAFMLFV